MGNIFQYGALAGLFLTGCTAKPKPVDINSLTVSLEQYAHARYNARAESSDDAANDNLPIARARLLHVLKQHDLSKLIGNIEEGKIPDKLSSIYHDYHMHIRSGTTKEFDMEISRILQISKVKISVWGRSKEVLVYTLGETRLSTFAQYKGSPVVSVAQDQAGAPILYYYEADRQRAKRMFEDGRRWEDELDLLLADKSELRKLGEQRLLFTVGYLLQHASVLRSFKDAESADEFANAVVPQWAKDRVQYWVALQDSPKQEGEPTAVDVYRRVSGWLSALAESDKPRMILGNIMSSLNMDRQNVNFFPQRRAAEFLTDWYIQQVQNDGRIVFDSTASEAKKQESESRREGIISLLNLSREKLRLYATMAKESAPLEDIVTQRSEH
jgi:hypothetical protein